MLFDHSEERGWYLAKDGKETKLGNLTEAK